MVKNKKYIIISFLILFLLPNIVYSIESAAHKVEVAKCFGIIMTIKNNSKYENNISNQQVLVQKIKKGGSGNWGNIPMMPHPNITNDELNLMVRWILDL